MTSEFKGATLTCQPVRRNHPRMGWIEALEVVGVRFPDGTDRSWPLFYGDRSGRYFNEIEQRRLIWPEKMLGRLALACDTVFTTEPYYAYGHGNLHMDERRYPRYRWNCYSFAAMMAPEYDMPLEINQFGFTVPQDLHLGSEVAPDATKNAVPYFIGPPGDRPWGHAALGTHMSGVTLSALGGLRALALCDNELLTGWYGNGIRPYLLRDQ